ncbi:MAG: DUF2950 domain-containing protein [Methyloceanibacter sp.]|jgi:hypothetical protein|nr:DUF2950 domain-containing protein [Methyloceanibacter sp.]
MVESLYRVRWLNWGLVFGAVLLVGCTCETAQKQFDSPDAAVEALVSAAKDGNQKALLKILGPDGRDVISSGDKVADTGARKRFIAGYEKKHSLTPQGDDKNILIMGEKDWPFPIPIVSKDGKWEFDTAAGLEEILLRRIGRNELNAIQVELAYVAAQNDYAALDTDGYDPRLYAQRIVSSKGKKDGLYWPSGEGESQSPLGALFAEASAQGYKVGDKPIPYHGYVYRILKRQGPDAAGGAFDYVVDGNMIGGFALIARPAQYGNSGVMTFIVNHDGVVFQKDLGPDTPELAEGIDAFSPDSTWTKVELP